MGPVLRKVFFPFKFYFRYLEFIFITEFVKHAGKYPAVI